MLAEKDLSEKEFIKIPWKCPMCDGTGHIPAGFYDPYDLSIGVRTWISSGTAQEICLTCQGTGVVWGKE